MTNHTCPKCCCHTLRVGILHNQDKEFVGLMLECNNCDYSLLWSFNGFLEKEKERLEKEAEKNERK